MPGPQACLTSDPLSGSTVGLTGAYVPAYNNLGTNNAQTRQDPNRWNVDRDSAVRGRY
ncbi:MAG TPA: transcriptional regulator, partial [Phenylobacterium sp.]|nr:transcriptional regulator [Phenylobacterium sp.]